MEQAEIVFFSIKYSLPSRVTIPPTFEFRIVSIFSSLSCQFHLLIMLLSVNLSMNKLGNSSLFLVPNNSLSLPQIAYKVLCCVPCIRWAQSCERPDTHTKLFI